MKNLSFGLVFLMLATILSAGAAGVPGSFNYQGVLRDGVGGPMPAQPTLVHFNLYDAATGGTLLWTNETTVLLDSNGLFNVTLPDVNGKLTGVIASNSEIFLGLAVGTGSEISPRQQLLSVPFALKAGDVSQASGDFTVMEALSVGDGADITGQMKATSVQIGGINLTTNSAGNLNLAANVDVTHELHVMQNMRVDGATTVSNLIVKGETQVFTRNSLNNNTNFISWRDGSAKELVGSALSDGFIIINTRCYFYLSGNVDNNDMSFDITFSGGTHGMERTVSRRLKFYDIDSGHGLHQSDIITLPVLKGEKVTATGTNTPWALDGDSTIEIRWYFVPFGTTK